MVEAAAQNLPVIASRIGGLPEFVEDGRTGLLFEPGHATQLAAIMQGLLSGTITLTDQADACRALAQRHTVDRMVDGYLQHYRRLLPAGVTVADCDELDHAA